MDEAISAAQTTDVSSMKTLEAVRETDSPPDESEKENCNAEENDLSKTQSLDFERSRFVRPLVKKEISQLVIRSKLKKRRHLVLSKVIDDEYLQSLFPKLLQYFSPQPVQYNGGRANIQNWKISCYLEVMSHGIPTAEPNLLLLHHFTPLLQVCDSLFLFWYQQQHSCPATLRDSMRCRRLMTFITRYTSAPNEQALLKHIDGAGKVDGSLVVALPIDQWSAPYEANAFVGGGLTFWDGVKEEIHYDTRSGDVAFIDRAVWHQADPITQGTRWALVIFYKVDVDGLEVK